MAAFDRIVELKRRLDALRPLSKGVLDALAAWYEVELTFTSNAIEGNALTRSETALVLEQGIRVRGKRRNTATGLKASLSATPPAHAFRAHPDSAARERPSW
jgi:Fic family protein